MRPAFSDGPERHGFRRDHVHLADYWHVVRRRWWLILLTTAVAIAGALWAASRSPQLYQAYLTLQVGDPRGRTGQIGDLDVSANLLWTDPVESELQQLTTQAVASYVVDSLQLRAVTPGADRDWLLQSIYVGRSAPPGEYQVVVGAAGSVSIERPSSGRLAEGERGALIEFGDVAVTVQESVPPGSYSLHIVSQRTAEARVRGGLAATTRPETNLIDVTYTGTDRALAVQILNGAADALRALGVRRLREWAHARTLFIQEQQAESRASLQRALEAVEDYKERRGVTSLSAEEARLLTRLGSLQSQLEELVIDRSIYNSLINKIGSANRPEDIQQFAVLTTRANRAVQFYFDALLQLLADRTMQLGPPGKDPAHPDIIRLDRRIVETQERLIAATDQAATALEARITAVTESLEGLQLQLNDLPAVETDLASLQNQVEINTDMYKYLLSRQQESRIAEAEISPYVEVVDPATWARPVSGGQAMNAPLGALIGLLLGVGAVFFLEYLDRSIQSSTDVESALGLPVLGVIPEFDQDPEGRPIPLVAEQDPDGLASEAYRVLRTNLAFSTSREKPLSTLLFTSPGPGEGKSTTVANLATVLAALGDRTLIVDADLRRGALHEIFDLLDSPGLSDLLVGGIDAREAIRPEVRPNLDVLPSGQRPPNPSELLGSGAMSDMIASWRGQYRWILLDAPPVLAVTDPAVLATKTDATVVVVRAGETDRRAAWRAFEQLRRIDVRVAGAVLNELKRKGIPDTYYMDYYYGRAG